MAVFRKEPRPAEPTEKRIVEVTSDGKIVSSEPLDTTTERAVHREAVQPPPQVVQAPPQVIRVKRGGSGALMLLSLVLMIALVGLGVYVFQMRDDTETAQQAELALQQQRNVAEEKLDQLGRAADDLGAQVRDTQRDLGIPASPPPAAASPSTTPGAATPAPSQPSTPPPAPQ
jgi:uncharacterized protein HemX